MSYLYKQLEDATGDELRKLAEQLQTANQGLYVIVSNNITQNASSFIISVAPQYESVVDMVTLSKWLEQTAGLKGGGRKGMLQGGGPLVHQDLGKLIKAGLLK
jgi:alanyl-tRNA synthetase